MDLRVFNAGLFLGWLLVLIGGVSIHPGAGFVAGGILLIVLVLIVSRIAGIFAPSQEEDTNVHQ